MIDICPRSLQDQAQIICNSGLGDCRFCPRPLQGMHAEEEKCAEFCSSGAAEAASRNFWIMIEFSNDLQIICHNSGIPPGLPAFKGKQGEEVCGCEPWYHNPSRFKVLFENLFSHTSHSFSLSCLIIRYYDIIERPTALSTRRAVALKLLITSC